MNSIRNLLNSEPVIVRASLVIITAVAAKYGLDWDPDVIFNTVLVLIGGGALSARGKVTPTDSVTAH